MEQTTATASAQTGRARKEMLEGIRVEGDHLREVLGRLERARHIDRWEAEGLYAAIRAYETGVNWKNG